MTALLVIGIVIILLFGFAVFMGAPYLPTLRERSKDALDLLNLKPGQILLELGSGDGRVLRAAAQRQIYSIGYEINPILFLYSKVASWRQREFITIRMANYWMVDWPKADAIYTFLLDPYMSKLDKKIVKYCNTKAVSIRLVSFAFKIPGKKINKQTSALFLYKYK